MSDMSLVILVVALVVTAITAIPYLAWWIVFVVRKQWRRVAILTAVPIVLGIVFGATTSWFDAVAYRTYLSEVYDTDVELGEPVFEFHSERHFNGDGYSLRVYKLPDTIRARFEAADIRLRSDYPKLPADRDQWDVERWREAPIETRFADYLSFALSASGDDTQLDAHLEGVRAALARNGTFYAFFKFDHGEHPGNIDLFVVDLEGATLYQINHNT